jgi:hypothetical protein
MKPSQRLQTDQENSSDFHYFMSDAETVMLDTNGLEARPTFNNNNE